MRCLVQRGVEVQCTGNRARSLLSSHLSVLRYTRQRSTGEAGSTPVVSRVPGPRQAREVQTSQTSGSVCAAKEAVTGQFLPHCVRHSGRRGPGHGPREGCVAVCVGSVVSVAVGAPRNPGSGACGCGRPAGCRVGSGDPL